MTMWVYVYTLGAMLEDVEVFEDGAKSTAYAQRNRTRCELMERPYVDPPNDAEWEQYARDENVCVEVWVQQ